MSICVFLCILPGALSLVHCEILQPIDCPPSLCCCRGNQGRTGGGTWEMNLYLSALGSLTDLLLRSELNSHYA